MSDSGVAAVPAGPVEEPILRVESLHKRFRMGDKEVHVLRGIDFSIRPRETVAILGASGVGKTTFLHLLGALDRPTSGRILYRGLDLANMTESELAAFRNRRVGFVFQFHYLLSDFTASENVQIPALIGGQTRRQARQRAEALLRDLGLGDRLDHRPGNLSGGEQQRVAVARALANGPEILLADEPTGNLDTATAGSVEDLLIGLRERHGVTLVVATHNPNFAKRLDRQVHMVDGRLVEHG